MKRNITTLVLSILLVFTSIAQNINNEESIVNFKIGNMKFNTVSGTFSGMSGNISFNTKNLSNSSFDICIDVNTVNTENKKRDDHLRTSDFFDAQKFPAICFKSNKIIESNGTFHTIGSLTMHGITNQVDIPFSFSNNVFKGIFTLDRLDYLLGKDVSKFMVGNEVEIEIVCTIYE